MEESEKSTHYINLRVTPEIHAFLEAEAKRRFAKKAWIMKEALREYKDRIEAENPLFKVIPGEDNPGKKAEAG